MTISVIKLHTRERQITIVVNSAYRLEFICSLPAFFVSYSGISLFLPFPCPNFFIILYPYFLFLIFPYPKWPDTSSIPAFVIHTSYTPALSIPTFAGYPHFLFPQFAIRSPQSSDPSAETIGQIVGSRAKLQRRRKKNSEGNVIFFGFNPHRSFSIQCF